MRKFERKLARQRRKDVARRVHKWMADPHVETVTLYREETTPSCSEWSVKAEVVFNLRLLTYDEVYPPNDR